MLWTATQQFHPWPFEMEVDLENTITELQRDLFGTSRVYLETKKLIGQPGKTQNIPDGYLLDFSGPKKPVSLFGASWACKARSVASHRPTIAGLFPVVSEYAAPSPQECGNIASIHRRDVTRCLHC